MRGFIFEKTLHLFVYIKQLFVYLSKQNKVIMTTQEIYNLSNELTDQQVNNILGSWENTNELESINSFNTLVSLGDSKQLACATVIAEKVNKKSESNIYSLAYES